jgi:hypothetical protein
MPCCATMACVVQRGAEAVSACGLFLVPPPSSAYGAPRWPHNPHFHAVVLDGVYVQDEGSEERRFVKTPAPTDTEIKRLAETVASRVIRFLIRRGVIDETSCAPDPLTEEEPALAELLQASALGPLRS